MSTDIKVPTLGESVTEATVATWYKKVGDAVAVDEPLVELETDKVAVEVPSPVAGKLEAIVVSDGETVEVGALLATVAEGEAGAAADTPKQEVTPESSGEAPAKSEPAKANGEMPPSPSAAKLMEEKSISAEDIEGSGKRGQILKEDVLAAAEKLSAAPAPAATGSVKSMSTCFEYGGFTSRIVYVGITTENLTFPHAPVFHRREQTLLASRNALPADFGEIIKIIEAGDIDTKVWITHRLDIEEVPTEFDKFTDPKLGAIKAVINVND